MHPNNAECFYLKLLLINVRGPTSFQHIRTVDGHLYETFRDACNALQLLENDKHWHNTISDAIITSPPNAIRSLFAIIITTCHPADPKNLWENYRSAMSEDILHNTRQRLQNPN